MSVGALISGEINLQVALHHSSAATVDAFKDFAREPELLRNRQAVVWITYNGSVAGAQSRWQLPKLPPAAPVTKR
jgi:hypothetical protein